MEPLRENQTKPHEDGFPWNLLAFLAAKLAGKVTVRESESVEDYTNFSLFRHQLGLFVIQLIDQIFATSINIVTACLFAVVWSVFAPWAHFNFTSTPGKAFLQSVKNRVTTKVSSFVTLSTPNIYDTLHEKEKQFNPSVTHFSLDNALFLLGLSTLVYEDTSTIQKVLESLKLKKIEIEHEFVLKESCVFYAFYNIKRGYVVLAFKGTSPLNFTEWLTDFTLSKIAAPSQLLPGEVHQGFFNAFEFPIYIPKGEKTSEATYNNDPHYVKINDAITKVFGKFVNTTPRVWITGHSLGAALASVFFSYTVYAKEKKFPVLKTLRPALVGAYTFGTPRSGNSVYDREVTREYKEKLGKVFYRVDNANDIVCVAPLGGNTVVQRIMCKVTPNGQNLMSLTDYHHVGEAYVFPYYGRYEKTEHPSFGSRVRNVVYKRWNDVLAWYRLSTGQETLFSAVTRQVIPFCFFDHFPSEYERHLLQQKKVDEDNKGLSPTSK